jgi:hypothetical protein
LKAFRHGWACGAGWGVLVIVTTARGCENKKDDDKREEKMLHINTKRRITQRWF